MRLRFLSRMVNDELDFLVPYSLLADLLMFIVSLPFFGIGIPVPAGLLLGTLAMTVNIAVLGYASERAVEMRTKKAAKRYMFFFYLLRMTIMGAAMVIGFRTESINSAAVCVPLFYPRIFYTVRAVIQEKKGG